VATGPKPAEEFRFYHVKRTEPGGARLRLWHGGGCESIDCCVAKGIGSAKSVSLGALGGEPVRSNHTESVRIDDSALVRGLGTQPNWTFGKSADPEREHATVVSQRQHAAIKP